MNENLVDATSCTFKELYDFIQSVPRDDVTGVYRPRPDIMIDYGGCKVQPVLFITENRCEVQVCAEYEFTAAIPAIKYRALFCRTDRDHFIRLIFDPDTDTVKVVPIYHIEFDDTELCEPADEEADTITIDSTIGSMLDICAGNYKKSCMYSSAVLILMNVIQCMNKG